MPTLEPAYEQAEEILFTAIESVSSSTANGWVTHKGGKELDPELAAYAEAVYRDLERWALIIFNGLRLVGSRIYEREKAATFWKTQSEWALCRLQ